MSKKSNMDYKIKNPKESHLDKWQESLKDPEIRKEWEELKKQRNDKNKSL